MKVCQRLMNDLVLIEFNQTLNHSSCFCNKLHNFDKKLNTYKCYEVFIHFH